VPGAPENDGDAEGAGLNDGNGPAGGGGLGGRDECCGAVVDEAVCEALRPGGGGKDMMNDRTVDP
jgi:hypothetical protein